MSRPALVAGALLLGAAALTLAARGRAPLPAVVKRPGLAVTADALVQQARVILVTLDGARWQDVLDEGGALRTASAPPAMPKTLALIRDHGVALRARTSSAIPLSLPGYQVLLTGRPSACADNDCPRVAEETVAEALARRLPSGANTTAVFASWAQLSLAASSRDGAVTVDAPDRGPPKAGGPPWDDARWDAQTADRALAFWRAQRPRFMHLALLDMDEHAHRSDPAATVGSLRAADEVIAALADAVKSLPPAEQRLTTILITADHGRGPGPLWPGHGTFEASRDIFLLAIGEAVVGGEEPAEQLDVRPTIERLFGLRPEPGPGHALKAIVGSLPVK